MRARAREHRVHTLRRQPRRTPGAEPRRCRSGRVTHPPRTLGHLALRLPDGPRAASGDPRAPRGGVGAVAPRPRLARARDARRVPPRGPGASGWTSCSRCNLDRRRQRRGSTRSPTCSATATRRSASPAGARSGTATVAGSSPTSTVSSPKTPSCDPITGSRPSPPSSGSACPRPSGRRSSSPCRTGGDCGSAARPTGWTVAPRARSSSSTTRPGVRSGSATTATPPRRGPSSSSPCTRSRPGVRSGTTTRRWLPRTGS